MLNRFHSIRAEFPAQYWLLFCGLLISFTGASFVWPYLLLYISKTLSLPLSSITWLLTLNLGMGLVSSFIGGPITDRLGRKLVIVVGLLLNGLAYLLYCQAHTLAAFAIVGAFGSLVSPLYKIGANSMITDMVPGENRVKAFALMRMSNNLAVVIGPPIGGFLVTRSYTLAFIGAAAGMILYGISMIFLGHETVPDPNQQIEERHESFRTYGKVLQDHHFLAMVGSLTLTYLCACFMWTLLSVYTHTEFNLPEKAFGWIPMTNALMVVFLQVMVTAQTNRHSPLLMMSIGSFFFAVGVGSVAIGAAFWAFWMSMVVMSIGELIVVPTADNYVARLAPTAMRGRYMSIAGLAWVIGNGIAPVIGGYLNDTFSPATIWYAALALGMAGATGFMLLEVRNRKRGQVGDRWWAKA